MHTQIGKYICNCGVMLGGAAAGIPLNVTLSAKTKEMLVCSLLHVSGNNDLVLSLL